MSWQPLSLTLPADIDGASTLADLNNMTTSASTALVHPFQYGIGEGERARLLTFPNAVDALATKMQSIRPQAITCIAFATTTLAGLTETLLTAVNETGLKWLITPCDRAKLLNSLEQDKITLMSAEDAPIHTRTAHNVLHATKLNQWFTAKGSELALAESANAVGSIADELSAFESAKTNHDTQINSAFSGISAGTADGYALHLSGGSIASQLREAGGPGAEKTYAVIMAFYGNDENLNIIKQWVGL